MSQGAWQDWDDEEYRDYLERYYGMQLVNTKNILKSAKMTESEALLVAVFNKIASPSVYLQPHFKAWREKQKANAIPEREPAPTRTPSSTPNERWKPTGKNPKIEWCSERDAMEEEMTKALDPNIKDTWYMPPREGYQYGAIFRKLKP